MRAEFKQLLLISALSAIHGIARADGISLTQQGSDSGTPACATCHGKQGEGMAMNGFPRLAGIQSSYLHVQLDAFANGQRPNAMMSPIAKTLSPQDRQIVADYYAALPAPLPATPTTTPNSAGQRLAEEGRWSQGLPACVQCHGALGSGVGGTFPALAGQSAVYIENQLYAWQHGQRAPGPLGLMKKIADKLSAADIHDVASYFSTLAPDPISRSKP